MTSDEYPYAGQPASFWLRAFAKLTDLGLVNLAGVLFLCVVVLLDSFGVPDSKQVMIFTISCIGSYLVYFTFTRSCGRQSIGQRWAGIKVITLQAQPLSVPRSLFRACLDTLLMGSTCCGVVNGAIIDYSPVVFTKSKRAVHDLLTGTQVVRVARPQSAYVGAGALLFFAMPYMLYFSILKRYVVEICYIPSGAMRPTVTEKDRVTVNKMIYHLRGPRKQDVVVFRAPAAALGNTRERKNFIKRIIGVGGDIVEVRKGKVYVNSKPLSEPYIAEPPNYEMKIVDGHIYEIQTQSQFPVQLNNVPVEDGKQIEHILHAPPGRIPNDAVLVLGDNRNDSNDSHKWGFLPTKNLVGKAMFVFYPEYRKL